MTSLFALFLLAATPAQAASDFLAQVTVKIDDTRSSAVLDRVVANPKEIFEHYQPALDSGSKIVRPVQVTGSDTHPIMQVSIRKCVTIVCETVDLDADITLREGSQAGCDRAFQLTADLTRSSDIVANIYDRLDTSICYKASADGRGVVNFSASANQAPSYSRGYVQGQMFSMLKLQVQPIVAAIETVIHEQP